MLPLEPPRPDDDELDLRAYLQVVVRRWKVIAAVAVLGLLVAGAFVLQQKKEYRAESEVLIRQSDTASIIDSASVNASDAARRLNNEVELFESGTVRKAVESKYRGPLDPKRVRASTTSDSNDVITAHVTARDPKAAADLLNTYVETFIDVRRQRNTDELLAVRTQIQQKIDGLGAQIAAAKGAAQEQLRSQQTAFQSQIDSLDVGADITQTGVQVLTEADVPTDPVSPQPVRDLAVAIVLSLVLGLGLAFLVDSLDERIRNIADLERIAGDIPVLATIPVSDTVGPGYVATRDATASPQAEAFRSLRTTVKFAGVDGSIRVLQVTSANQGDGKTTAVANLAVAFAQGSERVLVACCDLRRPTVHQRFGADVSPGFTDVIVGDATLESAVRRAGSFLGILPAGTEPRNPSELLSSERARMVVEAMAGQADVLLLDTTPVLPVSDSLVVSRFVDAVLVVVDARSTTRKAVRRTLQLLHQVNAPILGLVLNGISEGEGYGTRYGYGQTYDDRGKARRHGSTTDASAGQPGRGVQVH
jgi:capsular exopolysaccharide synthesis family protein